MERRDGDDAVVTFTVREILGRMELAQTAGFTEIRTALSSKADKADVARMEARLDQHGQRIEKLEGSDGERRTAEAVHARRDEAFWTRRNKVFGAVGMATMIAATLLGPNLGHIF